MKAPHPITGEIQVRKIHKVWYIFLVSSGRSSSFSLALSVCLIPTCFFSLSSRSTMTGTWETWLSMCCRPGTWPRGTTTVTRTLLSRFTSYQGEGELPVSCESSRISVLCLPFCFCVCLVVSPLFSFWPCIHCAVLELTNWFCLYERMRMDTMTWGSHSLNSAVVSQRGARITSIQRPSVHPNTVHSLAVCFGVLWSGSLVRFHWPPLLISLYCLHTSLKSKRKNRYTFSCSVTVSALR